MTMVSPKQLGVGDSDVTLSRRKSLRSHFSKRTAPEVTEVEEETKKRKQKKMNKKKKTKLSEPLITRIWNDEDVLSLLKGLVDYRAKTGLQSKIDWDEFYRFTGGSIVEKFSKDQVKSKMRKLKKKYYVQMEKIKKGNDWKLIRSSDYEVFGYSNMIWGENEAAMDKEMLNEPEEQLNDNAAVTEQQSSGRLPQQSEGGEMLKEKEQEANVGKEDGAAKKTENETNGGKENHDDNDEICAVRDAFETVMSQGLTDYQKNFQLEKLGNIGADKRRELSDGWKALCVEERRLNIKKLRYSTKLAEAIIDC